MLDYISRAQLFTTQQEWFEAVAKRERIIKVLFEDHWHLLIQAGLLCRPLKS